MGINGHQPVRIQDCNKLNQLCSIIHSLTPSPFYDLHSEIISKMQQHAHI